jgi:hypothetical protein
MGCAHKVRGNSNAHKLLCGNLARIHESQVNLPNHYNEIGRNCYRKEWEYALKEEFDSLEEIGVFKLVDSKPPGRKG